MQRIGLAVERAAAEKPDVDRRQRPVQIGLLKLDVGGEMAESGHGFSAVPSTEVNIAHVIYRGKPSRRWFVIGTVSGSLAALSGCGGSVPTAREALLAAKAFIGALLLLEQASRVFQGYVSEAVASTRTELNGKRQGLSPNLPQIALNWEEKWNNVIAETAQLEKTFVEVKYKSDEYWAILDKVTNAIGDSKLRDAEDRKNREAKIKWETAYEAASTNIGRAKVLRDKGNDMKQMMLAAALRRQIAEYTTTLDSIAREAESLLKSLETLTEQGRSIVTITPIGRQ